MNNLKKIRLEKGETLQHLADAIGSSKQNLSDIETGKTNITQKMIITLCSYFGVSADYLLGITPPLNSKNSDIELLWESLDQEDQAFILKQMKILSSQKKDNSIRVADNQVVLEDVNRKTK